MCKVLTSIIPTSSICDFVNNPNIQIFDGDDFKVGKYISSSHLPIKSVKDPSYKEYSKVIIGAMTYFKEIKNDLSEFGVESDAPDLFNNDSESLNSNELLSTDSDDEQEDDLEIPAFLRRQKN